MWGGDCFDKYLINPTLLWTVYDTVYSYTRSSTHEYRVIKN